MIQKETSSNITQVFFLNTHLDDLTQPIRKALKKERNYKFTSGLQVLLRMLGKALGLSLKDIKLACSISSSIIMFRAEFSLQTMGRGVKSMLWGNWQLRPRTQTLNFDTLQLFLQMITSTSQSETSNSSYILILASSNFVSRVATTSFHHNKISEKKRIIKFGCFSLPTKQHFQIKYDKTHPSKILQ